MAASVGADGRTREPIRRASPPPESIRASGARSGARVLLWTVIGALYRSGGLATPPHLARPLQRPYRNSQGSADRRATTAWVRPHARDASRGSRIRTWLLANVTSDGLTPGSPPPASSRIAVARDSPSPNRTTSWPSSRDIEATPAASAVSRSSATSTRRTTGGGIGPKRSSELLAERREIAAGPGPGEAPVELELLRLLGHVVVRQVGLDRQVDHGLRPLDPGRPILAQRLALLDGLGEEARVQVEADRRHVARLLAAEDVARAADLEVGERDLEPGTELRRVEDRLEPLPGLLAHPLAAAVEQVGVGPPAATARPGRGAGRAGRARACRRGR